MINIKRAYIAPCCCQKGCLNDYSSRVSLEGLPIALSPCHRKAVVSKCGPLPSSRGVDAEVPSRLRQRGASARDACDSGED